MAPRYKVTLTKEERKNLEAISTKGKRAARTVLYARALLLLDAGEYGPKWVVAKVAEALGTTSRSLEHLKKRFVEEGLPAAIERKKRVTPPREIQFGGEFEANFWPWHVRKRRKVENGGQCGYWLKKWLN